MADPAGEADAIRRPLLQVLWMFVREGLGLGLVGAAIGVAGALALTRVIASLLFGIEPTDPATLSLGFAALVAAAALASLVPA
jgi:putative ABC transport system permease protein